MAREKLITARSTHSPYRYFVKYRYRAIGKIMPRAAAIYPTEMEIFRGRSIKRIPNISNNTKISNADLDQGFFPALIQK